MTCSKRCNKNKASTPGGSFRVGLLGDQFSGRQRAGQTFTIKLDQYCVVFGAEVLKPAHTVTLVYEKNGSLDRKKSDF